MTLHTKAQCLDTLQEDEGIEGRDSCTSITQDDGTNTGDVGCCSYCVGKDDTVIRGIGLGQCGELVRISLPIELATIDDDTTQRGTMTTKNFVAECTTMSAPCSRGRMR